MNGVPVRLEACAKTFPGHRALEPLSLQITGGETVVLLGPSGCGKTTTLRIMAGLEAPDPGGRVYFGDEDVTAIPIERRNVGMVFQSYALFPNMSVAQNIAYGLAVRGVDRRERGPRVDEMLGMMQIEALAQRRIDQLSGGQRQRVALARAIAIRPRVLLLDEPLAALDAKLRETLRIEIDLLLRRLGITAIYVTHDQSEAMALGDRIVVMNHGRVAQIGTPREIYQRPVDRFVADFIGTMNAITEGDGREALFRPEDAILTENGPYRGRLVKAFFLGDRVRLVIEGVSERPCIIETADRVAFEPGSPIAFDLRPGALLRL